MKSEVPVIIRNGRPLSETVPQVQSIDSLFKEKNERFRTDWQTLQYVLGEEAQSKVPDQLVDQMGLARLHWQFVYHPYALSLLFLGTDHQETSVAPSEALAVIEIERNLDGNAIVYASGVHIGGLKHDSKGMLRAIGMNYTPWVTPSRVVEFDVSISDTEPPFDRLEADKYKQIIQKIPTQYDYPHYTAGFITDRMMQQVGSPKGILRSYDPYRGTHELRVSNRLGYEDTTFTIEHRNNQVTVHYEGQKEYRWHITVPETLDTV